MRTAQADPYRVERPALRTSSPEKELDRPPGSAHGLPGDLADRLSLAFGQDITGVRIHPQSPRSARQGAAAAASGDHVAFAPGLYRPGTPDGDRLIAHELAHVVQQRGGSATDGGTTPSRDPEAQAADAARAVLARRPPPALVGVAKGVQLREFGPTENVATLGPGDWSYADRLNNTARWRAACRHNLLNLRSDEYTQIAERTEFYWWFYNEIAARGDDVRWPLAAAVVAGNANELGNRDPAGIDLMRTNEVEAMLRRGNQVIFDDVFPKLRALYLGPPLKGDAALAWDSQVLIEEQNLVQPLYAGMSPDAVTAMESAARQEGPLFTVGGAIFGSQRAGPHNVGGTAPAFPDELDIRAPVDRWRYGMMLAHFFAAGSARNAAASLRWAMSLTPPTPRTEYAGGTKLAEVDRFAGLHRVMSMITSVDLDRAAVRTAIHALSPAERAVLARDAWPVAMLRHRHGMSEAQARALLTSEDITGCVVLQVIGHVEGTGTYAAADRIIVTRRPGASWTARGGTRRVQVQAVSDTAHAAFIGVPLRWVWEDSLHCYHAPTPRPVPPPVEVTYPVLFDTANADLERDGNSAANVVTLNRLLEQIGSLRGDPSVERIELHIVGQASPRWRGELGQAGKFGRNLQLSKQRAANVEAYLSAAYRLFQGPVPIVVVGPVRSMAPLFGDELADRTTRASVGSLPGLALSMDSDDNDQRFRRVDVMLRVTFR